MLKILLSRLIQMLAIMAVISVLLFLIFDSEKSRVQLAVSELGSYGYANLARNPEAWQQWVENHGFSGSVFTRYSEWITNLFSGDFGWSYEKSQPVSTLLKDRLLNTGILAMWVFILMIPIALVCGVFAGIKQGSVQDRAISFFSVFFTSIPEIATAIILTVIFSLWLGWLPPKSAMINGFNSLELVLPVAALVLYDFGYVARMTRASMVEVMTSNYIRTANLKGLPYTRVIVSHALRNALIAPFTVIVLQLNWLLSGVVVIEIFFEYDGFGKMLLEGALFPDPYVIQAGALVAAFIAVLSQLISDIGYTILNPRIRF